MFKTLNAKDMKSPWTRWFIYGDTGTGKTSAASTFPRPLFLIPEIENSIATLSGLNFPYIIIKDWSSPFNESLGTSGMNAILQRIEMEYNKDPNAFPYDTIIPDGVTHLAELICDELTQGSKVSMDQQKYGKLTAYFRNMHARLSRLQLHTVYCALAHTDEAQKGSAYLSKKASMILPASCEVYAYMRATGGDGKKDGQGREIPKRCFMHTQPYSTYIARTRYKRLPAVIEDFRFDAVKGLLINSVEDVHAEEPSAEEAQDISTAADEPALSTQQQQLTA